MNLPLFIAWRYLFARKSHNVINIISALIMIQMFFSVKKDITLVVSGSIKDF